MVMTGGCLSYKLQLPPCHLEVYPTTFQKEMKVTIKTIELGQ